MPNDVPLETAAPEVKTPTVSLRVHPMRAALYDELHNRPSPVIEGGCQVTHFTVMLDDKPQNISAHVIDLCRRYSVPSPAEDATCLYQDFGGFELRWERHTEFANFTFICPEADVILAARKVGVKGKVIGVDMTGAMIDKARQNINEAGLGSVAEIRKGIIESLPVESNSVDWVISNCVVSLSPDKEQVFAEVCRVLKPGGKMLITDLVTETLP